MDVWLSRRGVRDPSPSSADDGNMRQGVLLGSGDMLGDPVNKFKLLRRIFPQPRLSASAQLLPSLVGNLVGLNWAKHSRLKRADGKTSYMGEDKEVYGVVDKGIYEDAPQY